MGFFYLFYYILYICVHLKSMQYFK